MSVQKLAISELMDEAENINDNDLLLLSKLIDSNTFKSTKLSGQVLKNLIDSLITSKLANIFANNGGAFSSDSGFGGVIDGEVLRTQTVTKTISTSNCTEIYTVQNDCALYIEDCGTDEDVPNDKAVIYYLDSAGTKPILSHIESNNCIGPTSSFYNKWQQNSGTGYVTFADCISREYTNIGSLVYLKANTKIYAKIPTIYITNKTSNRSVATESPSVKFTFIEYELTSISESNDNNESSSSSENNILTAINLMYPVGSIYLDASGSNTCPLSALITGSTWSKIGDKILTTDANGDIPVVGNGKGLGLTNGSTIGDMTNESSINYSHYKAGTHTNVGTSISSPTSISTVGKDVVLGVTTNPTKSGLKVDLSSSTISVNIWKRTA